LQENIQLAKAVLPGVPLTKVESTLAFTGIFLDTRSSSVFGASFFIACLMFAICLGYAPHLSFALFFGLTLLVAVFSVNPVLAFPSYHPASSFVISTGIYAAISIATLVFVFPQSFNHIWLVRVRVEVLLPVIEFLQVGTQTQSLSKILSAIQVYEMEKTLFDGEFSVHRLTPLELTAVYKHFKQLAYAAKALETCQRRIDKPKSEFQGPTESSTGISDRALQLCDNLRLACQVSLLDIEEWVRECNQDSWSDVFFRVDKDRAHHRLLRLQISSSNLNKAKTGFEEDELRRIISLIQCTDSTLNEGEPNTVQTAASEERTFILVFLDSALLLMNSINDLLSVLITIEDREPKPAPHMPPNLVSLFGWRRRGSLVSPSQTASRDLDTPAEGSKPTHSSSEPKAEISSYDVTVMATPPISPSRLVNGGPVRQRARILTRISSPLTAYALRMALLSVGLYSIGLCKSVVEFYFTYSGLVVIILAQSYINVYAGDQIYFFLIRFSATALALLCTLLSWFIIAGKGTSSPYAFVAMTTIMCLPSLLLSVSSQKMSHLLFGVLFSTTLVSTMSLIYSQVKTSPLPPMMVAFNNVWIRALLDIIGFIASAIMMMIPFPVTSRRGFNDKFVEALSEINEFLHVHWMDEMASISTAFTYYEDGKDLRSIRDKQKKLDQLLASMKFDPCIRTLPQSVYKTNLLSQKKLIISAAGYIGALRRLEPSLRRNLSSTVLCLQQNMLEKLQHYIVQIIEGQSETHPHRKLQDEIDASEDLELYAASGILDMIIQDKHLLALASAKINFLDMVEAVDQMRPLVARRN
ncbi:hypothetical protein HYPSUDRAFT_1085687, partial [Hypholoma sublateritium FD-334 SS-4]